MIRALKNSNRTEPTQQLYGIFLLSTNKFPTANGTEIQNSKKPVSPLLPPSLSAHVLGTTIIGPDTTPTLLHPYAAAA